MTAVVDTKRQYKGVVTSDKRDKTRTVVVKWSRPHERYRKVVKFQTKYQVHDPENRSKEGDIVTIQERSPVSKTKTMELVEIIA